MRNILFLFSFLFSVLSISQEQLLNEKDTIIVGYTSAPPFIIEEDGQLEGINIWLWQKAADELELSYKFQKMDFVEMLSAIENNAIDVSINPLTITGERSKKMEFTHAFYASNSTVVLKEKSAWNKFLDFIEVFFNANFLKAVLLLLAIMFIFGFFIWLFERHKNDKFRKSIRGIWDGFWWAAVTLTTVGYGDKAPLSKGGKVTALLLMFTGLLFISGLTASIASNLTVNELNNSPNSFIQFKDKAVGTVANSSSGSFLKEHFFKNITPYPGVQSGLEGLINEEIEAFMYDEPILKYRTANDTRFEKLQITPIKFDVQFYAFGISRNNQELEQLVSQRILDIMETQEWETVLNEYNLSEL